MGRQIGRREFLKRGTLAGVVTATGLPGAALLSGEATRTAVAATPATSSIAADELADLADRQR
jgi:nitrous oxide reductase